MPLMEFKYQGLSPSQTTFVTPLMEFKYQGLSPFQTTNVVVIDDDENDISPEFESYTNGGYNDENTNANKVMLKVGDTFKDWSEVDVIVNQYT